MGTKKVKTAEKFKDISIVKIKPQALIFRALGGYEAEFKGIDNLEASSKIAQDLRGFMLRNNLVIVPSLKGDVEFVNADDYIKNASTQD